MYRLINFKRKEGPPPKKAKPFEFEQFIKFFDHVDLNDRFQLVRAAAAVLLYFGANRVAEIKEVKFGGKKLLKNDNAAIKV